MKQGTVIIMRALYTRFYSHIIFLLFTIALSQITACGGDKEVIIEDPAPRLILEAEISTAENTSGTIYTATTDVNNPTFSLANGSDSTLFNINATTGELAFLTPPQHNASGNNTYTVQIQIANSDALLDTLINVTVTITTSLIAPSLENAQSQNYTTDSPITPLNFINNGGGLLTNCSANNLPAGLQINISSDGNTCEISGTPTELSEAVHTVTATNAIGSSSATVLITVTLALAQPNIADASPQTYTVDNVIPTLSFANNGGGSLTDCSADTLPAGLQVTVSTDSTTCEITGTPTTAQQETTHTITATNSAGNGSASVSIVVVASTAPPALADSTPKTYIINSAMPVYQFSNTGGGSLTDCSADTLPAGLQVVISTDTNTCEITGTPTATSENTHIITATNNNGSSNATISITTITEVPFITRWKTDNPGTSNDTQITIGTYSSATYNYQVDWGDGSTDTNVTGDITHTYSAAGTYNIEISGDFPQIYFRSAGDTQKLLSVEQWGNRQWRSMNRAFENCSNLVINAIDTPDLTYVTDMSYMFEGASSFNQDVSQWEVSSVTNMQNTFSNATTFNQDLSDWDVSSVTNMRSTFADAAAFNGNISNWDVSSVTNMQGIFANAVAFNQNISQWNVSSVTDMSWMFSGATIFNQAIDNWDVSNVTTMHRMFQIATTFNQPIGSWNLSSLTDITTMFTGASSFNQPIDSWNVSTVTDMEGLFWGATAFNQPINNWDVSSVSNMSFMFNGATNFNQDLSGWDVSSVGNMSRMFAGSAFDQNIGGWNITSAYTMSDMFLSSALSTANYDALLLGWSTQEVNRNVTFSAGNSTYSSSSQSAKDTLTETFNWTITDGGVFIPPSSAVR
ncbi:BspA family leucine-rich repeat surface protein [Aliikangiella sp. IMCC44359]|uniref:BspA family leucine-rich repeat surface protein n=1 Tax=Aliikangiella sp. IMCC44359 TaxID=3459125 RepID=UPI00403B1224